MNTTEMHQPLISIVIITLDEEARLPLLLGDLAKQSSQDFEIIHVDSNSDDNTVEVSRALSHQFSEYTIIEMPKRGVSLGRNVGAKTATGTRLLFLDADTRLAPGFLDAAITELNLRNLDVGVVCMSAEGLPLHYQLGYGFFNLGMKLTSRLFPTAIGACLFSTPEAHRKIDGFDKQLSLCEDCNYVLKAHQKPGISHGVIKPKFGFDPRRLDQDGAVKTGLTYLRANLLRFFHGELYKNEITYEFGHYR